MGRTFYNTDPARLFMQGPNIRKGKEFESMFVFNALKQLTIKKGYVAKDTINTDLDRRYGTDMICNGVRIDVTLNFSEKDHITMIKDSGIKATPLRNFKIGIRYGNSYKGFTRFDEPVVVIGVDMLPNDYRANEDSICDNVYKYAEDIFHTAESHLKTYKETDADYKKFKEKQHQNKEKLKNYDRVSRSVKNNKDPNNDHPKEDQKQ